eukprot:TRINITY_DN3596_c2_g1_i1.p1 TRINITY_DN3596_c2_g1~~TRINITY_DN3596_c2_g1_i1.p1  ORF type:complete len:100 (+),score=19.09 TRINITY_DN3596_c2_g1_i1:68-367(+)
MCQKRRGKKENEREKGKKREMKKKKEKGGLWYSVTIVRTALFFAQLSALVAVMVVVRGPHDKEATHTHIHTNTQWGKKKKKTLSGVAATKQTNKQTNKK